MQFFKKPTLLFFALTLLVSFLANAQNDTTKNTDPSLNGQYRFMLSKSKSLYGSRLINPNRLSVLWRSVTDTLKKERKELAQANEKINSQKNASSSLESEISTKQNALATATAAVNEIKFLGIPFQKNTYSVLVWSIIILLAIALGVIIFQSGKYRQEAKYRTDLYQEVADEFQNHKVKAKDKEMRLARELQDERNRWDDNRRG
ncbi:preprotein translocase subunit SecG/Sec-independent protein translocase protein TatA [Pedobacter sp. UYEF25]